MTVPATPRRAGPYDGTGAQTAFGFSFKAFDETDVRVVVLDVATNVETDALLNSDYTVTLNPDQESTPGGTATFFVAPPVGKKITAVGDLSYEQPSDLPDGGAYRAQQVENALDRLVMQMQQLKEIADRCAQVPVSGGDAAQLNESINVLAANLAILQTLVANIAALVALADDIADVNTLAAISAQIQTVAAIAADVVAVATIASEVVTVDSIAADVQLVAANMASILAAVADLPALAGKANSGSVTTSLLTMTSGRMLGRTAAGGGAIQELTAAGVKAFAAPPKGHLFGLGLSTAGASTTMTTAAGEAADATGAVLITLAANMAKTTAAWAAGTGNGGRLGAAAVANNTWYHWYALYNPTTGAVDVGFDLPGVVTYPAGFTHSRRIGTGRTNGAGQWLQFIQDGDFFQWVAPTNEAFTTGVSTPTLRTISMIPTGVSVVVRGAVLVANSAGAMSSVFHWDPALGAVKPGDAGVINTFVNTGVSQAVKAIVDTRTDTSARIYNDANGSSLTTYTYQALGWFDSRGKNA